MTVKSCGRCGEVKALAEYHRKSKGSPARRSICKSCHNAETVVSTYVSRHGLTRAEVIALAEKQGGCAICHSTDPGKRGWAVDHDHTCVDCTRRRGSCSSCRRDVLCNRCNTALGLMQDNPEIAEASAMYLRKWSGKAGHEAS